MTRTILITIIFSFLIASCCINKITPQEKEYWNKEIYGEAPFIKNQIPPEKINLTEFYDYEGYIFPKEYYPFWGERFTPTIDEIKKAEIILKKQHDTLPQFNNINLKKWYRQYIGNYDENHKKTIQINFIKISKKCIDKSEYGYLIDKWFIQTSDYRGKDEIHISDRIIID